MSLAFSIDKMFLWYDFRFQEMYRIIEIVKNGKKAAVAVPNE